MILQDSGDRGGCRSQQVPTLSACGGIDRSASGLGAFTDLYAVTLKHIDRCLRLLPSVLSIMCATSPKAIARLHRPGGSSSIRRRRKRKKSEPGIVKRLCV